MPIGTDIRTDGERLLATEPTITPEDLAHTLNQALDHFLPARFRAVRAHAIATDGTTSPEFLSVVVDTNRLTGGLGPEILAEAMACVIDVYNTLDLDVFRASYERIAQAKALPKADPAPEGDFRPSNVTLPSTAALETSRSDNPNRTLGRESFLLSVLLLMHKPPPNGCHELRDRSIMRINANA